MRIRNPRDLGLYVREHRHRRGQTQIELAASARVSRRWLSDLEAGKPTAEVGLVFRTLDALDITLDVRPHEEFAPRSTDLDEHLDRIARRGQSADEPGWTA